MKDKIQREKHAALIHVFIIASILYFFYFIFWRAFFTLNKDAMVLSVLMFALELYGIITYFLFAFMTWEIPIIPLPECPSGKSIDIYIPTYDEDFEILEATLAGCESMKYPHRTYLLDDGNRPEIKALARQWECNYITREENLNAKAGNINNAFRHTTGEFIIIIDADTVPQAELIEHTLGYFNDEKVAIVQLPQEFYNKDSFQHSKKNRKTGIWHEQTLFYRVIQPGKNRINSAFWCGSPSVIRRTALEEVGGVATETITEDIHTSIRLHSRGYKIIFHNEILAYGIAPQTLKSFSVQRLRWAQGTMQLLRSKENPLFVKGLTFSQRLSYSASTITYFDAYQKLGYFFIPIIILLTGKIPFSTSLQSFLLRWVPYFLLSTVSSIILGRGYYNYFEVEKFNFLKIFTFIKASGILIFPKKLTFKVTPKKMDESLKTQDRRNLLSFYIIIIICLLSVFIGLGNYLSGFIISYENPVPILAAFFWSAFNILLVSNSISSVLRAKYQRKQFRFLFNIFCEIKIDSKVVVSGIVRDLSSSGMQMSTSDFEEIQDNLDVYLYFSGKPLVVKCKINHKKIINDKNCLLGIEFLDMDIDTKRTLLGFLYVTAPHISNDLFSGSDLSPEELLDAHLKSGLFNRFL